jgi:site-specific recombinase XerD
MRPTWEKSCVGLFVFPKNTKGSETMATMILEENYEPTTINKKINSFQSFNEYLIDKGYMESSIIQLRKV